jgi:hypothetical protein
MNLPNKKDRVDDPVFSSMASCQPTNPVIKQPQLDGLPSSPTSVT